MTRVEHPADVPTPNPGVVRPWLRVALASVMALGLTLVCASPPHIRPKTDVDSSWCSVLDYAHAHQLQFGTDLVFTYGPLGYLVTSLFSPGEAISRLVTAGLLCWVTAFGLSLLALRLRLLWGVLLLGIFVLVAANTHSGADVLLNLGLLGCGLLCVLEEGPQLKWGTVILAGIAAFGVLVKLTYFISGGLCVGAVAADLALRGRKGLSLGVLSGFGAAVLAGWIAAGQAWSHLLAYAKSVTPLCSGFAQAMATDCPQSALWGGVLIGGVALVTVGLRTFSAYGASDNYRGARRLLLFSWLTGFLFLTWKHGFVRADRYHVEFYLFFVPVVLVALEALPTERKVPRELARALGVVCCVAAAFVLQRMFFPGYLEYCLRRPARQVSENMKWLMNPGGQIAALSKAFELERETNRLPQIDARVGHATADVFGWAQAYATFNNLNYNPRPMFQSYAAYNPELMLLNEEHFAHSDRPQFVLLGLSALDARLPALDDALLLRDVLMNYQLVDGEGSFLLFKSAPWSTPKLTLLRQGTVPTGTPILLPETDANVWMEVDLEPTLAGRVREFFYRPAQVRLKVIAADGCAQGAEFDAPAPMLSAGFLASPFLLGNGDVVELCTGHAVQRPKGYSVELDPAAETWWQAAIHYRLYRIEKPIGQSASAELQKLKFPGFAVAPSKISGLTNTVVIYKGKPALQANGRKIRPLDVVAGQNVILPVEGQPALLAPPGASVEFKVPAGVTQITGRFGFADASDFSRPNTTVEFRIELLEPGHESRLLHAEPIAPGPTPQQNRLRSFCLPLPEGTGRTLALRTVLAGEKQSTSVLSCWADVGFGSKYTQVAVRHGFEP